MNFLNSKSSNLPVVTINIYGTCLGIQRTGGYASILENDKRKPKAIYGGERQTTKSRMDLMAAIVGLEALKKRCLVTIWSDSKDLVEAMKERSVTFERQANTDLWERLLRLCDSNSVNFELINGCTDKKMHTLCKNLASVAARNLEAGNSVAISSRLLVKTKPKRITARNTHAISMSRGATDCPICGGLGYILRKSGPRSPKPTLRRKCPQCMLRRYTKLTE